MILLCVLETECRWKMCSSNDTILRYALSMSVQDLRMPEDCIIQQAVNRPSLCLNFDFNSRNFPCKSCICSLFINHIIVILGLLMDEPYELFPLSFNGTVRHV